VSDRDLLIELLAKIKACAEANKLDYDGDEGRNAQVKQDAGIELDDFVMVNGDDLVAGLERLVAASENTLRDSIIEECAKVCDAEWQGTSSLCRSKCAGDLARSLRGLKEKP
jgi:hypothetical protein